jgi:hypothetical protein
MICFSDATSTTESLEILMAGALKGGDRSREDEIRRMAEARGVSIDSFMERAARRDLDMSEADLKRLNETGINAAVGITEEGVRGKVQSAYQVYAKRAGLDARGQWSARALAQEIARKEGRELTDEELDAETAKISRRALEDLEPGEKTVDTAKVGPKGRASKDLKTSGDAVEKMSQIADTLNPAARDLRVAARELRTAVENSGFQRRTS